VAGEQAGADDEEAREEADADAHRARVAGTVAAGGVGAAAFRTLISVRSRPITLARASLPRGANAVSFTPIGCLRLLVLPRRLRASWNVRL
jgi:hypothetical protein